MIIGVYLHVKEKTTYQRKELAHLSNNGGHILSREMSCICLACREKSDPDMLNNLGSRCSDHPRLVTGSSGEIWKGLRLMCFKSEQIALHDRLDWNVSVFPQLSRGQ